MASSSGREMEIERGRRLRWARALGRALYLVIGALQCLFGVMFAVFISFSAITDFGDGPASLAQSLIFLAVVVALFTAGLFTLISAMENWEPPDDRWHGMRWSMLGFGGAVITLVSWAIVLALGLPG